MRTVYSLLLLSVRGAEGECVLRSRCCCCQFVELKASVFKKFEKHNLFQMSCSDVRERFHLLFLLMVVGVRNLTEFSWNMGRCLSLSLYVSLSVSVRLSVSDCSLYIL